MTWTVYPIVAGATRRYKLMRIWQVPYQLQILESGGGPRSPGMHVSEIIRDLSVRGGVLDERYATEPMSPERIELGIAWEERLAKHHGDTINFHPGEMVVDGVAMSMDGVSYNDETSVFTCDGEGALHEFKLTWKSSRREIDREFMWMTQIKSYLHGLRVTSGAEYTTAFLHAFFVNGGYGKSGYKDGPDYQIWGLEFTPLEIHENWTMLISHLARMKGRHTGL